MNGEKTSPGHGFPAFSWRPLIQGIPGPQSLGEGVGILECNITLAVEGQTPGPRKGLFYYFFFKGLRIPLDGKPTMSCANNPSVLRFLGSKGVLYQPHSLLRK